MAIKYAIGLTALLILGACGTTGTQSKSKTKTSIAVKQDRLAPRDLESGECGIFVWTADTARRFVFFSRTDSASGSWWGENGEIEVPQIFSDSQPAFEQTPNQTYQLPDGGELLLKLSDPEEVDNGTRYRAGSITQTTANGWDKVIPVSGIAACNVNPLGAEYSTRSIR